MEMIKAFYYGEPNPCDTYFPTDSKYKAAQEKHAQECKAFEEELMKIDPELIKRFRRLLEQAVQTTYLELDEMFVHGFRHGALMMLDILNTKKDTD